MAEVLHLMYKTLENQAVLLQDCGSKISLNKFCLHDWVSCLILMVECYTFTVYPPNHSHDDPKYSTCSLGYMFNQTVQWKTAPFNDFDLVMQNSGNLEFPKLQTLQCPTVFSSFLLTSSKINHFQNTLQTYFKPQIWMLIFSWNRRSISNHKKFHLPFLARLTWATPISSFTKGENPSWDGEGKHSQTFLDVDVRDPSNMSQSESRSNDVQW